ncbi:MAG: nuclear transport factor 2 family protein [Mycobacteriaceae bacterium]|nr:nuclear transport factor 2 family protein [Mycobacteriaceae bacterium]
MTAETEISNLLYSYAEFMDSGDFAGAADLFRHARLRVDATSDGTVDSATMLSLWRAMVIVYPDGTPRTKHLVTNPIIDVDDAGGTATCRSYYTVLQQTEDLALQVIVAGRYHDRFERVDGRWRFCYRDYSMMDQVGDVSQHLSQNPP